MARGIGTEEGQIEYCDRLVLRIKEMIEDINDHDASPVAELEALLEDVRADGLAEYHLYVEENGSVEEEGPQHITEAVENCPRCADQEIGKPSPGVENA